MGESSQGVTVVALLADPDAPTEVAQRMAKDLPDRLADAFDGHREFSVEVVSEPFTAGTEDLSTLTRRIVGPRGREELGRRRGAHRPAVARRGGGSSPRI